MSDSLLLGVEPVPTLVARVRAELSADFAIDRPTRVSRAPGRIDVMGGIADYSGATSLSASLDCGAAVALQRREDDQLQVFSFDQFDAHKPFTVRVPVRALAGLDAATLRREFTDPGRSWAAATIGCLHALHVAKLIDLHDPSVTGLNLAVTSTVPPNAGLGSAAAMAAATIINVVNHFEIGGKVDAARAIELCAGVLVDMAAAPGERIGCPAIFTGTPRTLTRALCQPLSLQPSIALPDGIVFFGIDTGARSAPADRRYDITRAATFMGHAIILRQMRELGVAAGATLTGDPMRGYLANLDPDDYKKLFRPGVPERLTGQSFLDAYGPMLDPLTPVDPAHIYLVQHATDHHVLEARRVRRFVESIEAAGRLAPGAQRKLQLDRAGHLMYASHQSYTMDAMSGADACDALVAAVRAREHDGFYGAKITAEGCGGTIAVLADDTPRARSAVEEIMTDARTQTGQELHAYATGGNGAWHAGTAIV